MCYSALVQLVRIRDCHSRGRRFESGTHCKCRDGEAGQTRLSAKQIFIGSNPILYSNKLKVMKELLRTIINKKFCCHDWELVEEVSTYSKAGDKLPYKRTRVYVCKKCGKFKQLTIQ